MLYQQAAPAKINLFLNLPGRRDDGFHTIVTIMHTLALVDTVSVKAGPGSHGPAFTCNIPDLTPEPSQNLVMKAYQLFLSEFNLPPLVESVHLEKRIPHKAGLGGGSSDAAAMLGLLWRIAKAQGHPLEDGSQLFRLAAQLGSDVPFFLSSGLALATGRGEIIEPMGSYLPAWPVVLAMPKKLRISTPAAYKTVIDSQELMPYQSADLEQMLVSVKEKNWDGIMDHLHNDFERYLFPHYPLLVEMKERFQSAGIENTLLSGSGPCMAGFLPPGSDAESNSYTRKTLGQTFPETEFDLFFTSLEKNSIAINV